MKVDNMPPNADEQFHKKIKGKTIKNGSNIIKNGFWLEIKKTSGIKLKKYIDAKVTCDLSNVAGALWDPESEVDFKYLPFSSIE